MSATSHRPFSQPWNPIWTRGLRARARIKHVVSWGLVVMTIAAFFVTMTYMTAVHQMDASTAVAARATVPVIIVFQAIVLMMSGTGSVAAGIARERDTGLLDYVRMAPMSPPAKIVGYIFGLPAREYVVFAMLMPFVIVAAIIGELSLLTLAHFYAVFFTSVLVYHMTAMATGMVTPKPRAAQLLSIGIVVMLYFVLPNLSRIGLTFFEFLTIRPTFFGLLYQELPADLAPAVESTGIDDFEPVPFFSGTLHPTVYTMLVQSFVFLSLFVMVHRRWRDETAHLVSKFGGLAVFGGIVFFLFGSMWAITYTSEAYAQIFVAPDRTVVQGPDGFPILQIGDRPEEFTRMGWTLLLLLAITGGILGGAFVLLIAACTGERGKVIESWRQARKLGRERLAWNADAAGSLGVALVMIVVVGVVLKTILVLAERTGEYYAAGPTLASMGSLVLMLVGSGLFVQALRSRCSLRVFGLVLFLLWGVPFFAASIAIAATSEIVGAAWLSLPSAPISLVWTTMFMLDSVVPLEADPLEFMPPEFREEPFGPLVPAAALFHIAMGAGMQFIALRHRARLRDEGLRTLRMESDDARVSPAA